MCRDQRTKGTEHSAQSFIISLRLNLTAQVSISISIIPKIVSEQKKKKIHRIQTFNTKFIQNDINFLFYFQLCCSYPIWRQINNQATKCGGDKMKWNVDLIRMSKQQGQNS